MERVSPGRAAARNPVLHKTRRATKLPGLARSVACELNSVADSFAFDAPTPAKAHRVRVVLVGPLWGVAAPLLCAACLSPVRGEKRFLMAFEVRSLNAIKDVWRGEWSLFCLWLFDDSFANSLQAIRPERVALWCFAFRNTMVAFQMEWMGAFKAVRRSTV